MRAGPRAIPPPPPPPPPSQMKCPGNEVEIEADDTRADDDIQISSDQIRSSAVSLNCIQLTVTILHYLRDSYATTYHFQFHYFQVEKTDMKQ